MCHTGEDYLHFVPVWRRALVLPRHLHCGRRGIARVTVKNSVAGTLRESGPNVYLARSTSRYLWAVQVLHAVAPCAPRDWLGARDAASCVRRGNHVRARLHYNYERPPDRFPATTLQDNPQLPTRYERTALIGSYENLKRNQISE